ncbi:MAG: PadR family transcriptional regulator [Thermoanaerobaculia bacterium]|jgi:PadR family transcriptional regulator PadR
MAQIEPFDREMKRGTLELLLLRLVRERRSYGYELASDLNGRSGGWIDLKEGTLYPVLYRLEDQGLIAAEWDPPARGVPRKYYKITAKGRKRLDELTESWRAWVRVVNEVLESSGEGGKQ